MLDWIGNSLVYILSYIRYWKPNTKNQNSWAKNLLTGLQCATSPHQPFNTASWARLLSFLVISVSHESSCVFVFTYIFVLPICICICVFVPRLPCPLQPPPVASRAPAHYRLSWMDLIMENFTGISYSAQCSESVYRVKCALFGVLCSVYSEKCAKINVQCIVLRVQCTI